MAILEWDNSFLLGIDEFDAHHRHLVGLINRTYDEYSREPTAGNLEGIIKELTDYASYHFDAEERWMEKISYPASASHMEEHRKFKAKIANFREGLKTGNITSTALFFFLAEWLTSHILDVDAEYGRYIKSRA